MRIAVTGTPGTGKTSATERLDTDLDVIHLNEVIREEGLYAERDEERDTLVADLDAIEGWLGDRDDAVIESHLAHYFDADRVVVLRCRPDELERRLRERGDPASTGEENAGTAERPRALADYVRENAESEALDVILAEAVERHGEGNVYEIDTTDWTPEEVAREIAAVIAGERAPSAGRVDFTDYL